jgi:hypothetical protein
MVPIPMFVRIVARSALGVAQKQQNIMKTFWV